MSTSWLVYTVLVPALLGLAAFAGERVLRLWELPARWPWALALAASVISAPASLLWSRSAGPADEAVSTIVAMDALQTVTAPVENPVQASWRDLLPAIPDGFERVAGAATLVASMLMLALLIGTLVRLRLERKRWLRDRVEDENVLVSSGVGPAVVGVVRPAIVLPRWLLGEPSTTRRLAVAHEREHVRAGDTRLLLLGCVAAALLPWSPAVWWQLRRLRLAIELDCDRRVLKAGAAPEEYGAMLLGVAARRTRAPVPALALMHPRRMIERRILAMTDNLPRLRALRAAGFAAAGAFVVALACDVPPPTDPIPRSETEAAISELTATPLDVPVEHKPLFVVDGVIVPDIADLEPLDIEVVDVMKGSAAQSLYGERAVRGVILITTKSGPGSWKPSAGEAEYEVRLEARARAEREFAVRALREIEAAGGVYRLREVSAPSKAEVSVDTAYRRAVEAAVEREAVARIAETENRLRRADPSEFRVRRLEESTTQDRIDRERAAAVAERVADERLSILKRAGAEVSVLERSAVRSDGAQPIYIVDGVIVRNGLSNIDALDIDKIEVIKGDAAVQLYGERARNGVISITTKR